MTEITNEQIQALIARGDEEGCVNLSHVNELVALPVDGGFVAQ